MREVRPSLAIAAVLALACGPGFEPPDAPDFVHGDGLDLTEPDLASASEGELALVFLGFDGARDRVMASLHRGGAWSEPIPVTLRARRALLAAGDGRSARRLLRHLGGVGR